METRIDFLKWLQFDMALEILMCLDDPSDIIRAGAVSRFWRHFVITNGVCKQIGLRLFPQLSNVISVTEPSHGTKGSADVGGSSSVEWEALEREHRAYAFLVRTLTKFTATDCIECSCNASSTDNYPEESIENTLDPREVIVGRASYWSSKGQSDSTVPEALIYRLRSSFCVVTEISVKPFQAYFQRGRPIYSAKYVRFRMGHPIYLKDIKNEPKKFPDDDKFIWTYTSQKFPMTQENRLQKFSLPEPALCIGGFLQIELFDRVQKQEMDGLYYVCVCHVDVQGWPLFPAFDVEIVEPSGKFLLKYYPEKRNCPLPPLSRSLLGYDRMRWLENVELMEGLEQFMNMLPGNVPDHLPYLWDDDDDNDMDLDM